eukprot:121986-Pyramimonas_sp.AAC.1
MTCDSSAIWGARPAAACWPVACVRKRSLYEAFQKLPNRLHPAVDWRNVGMHKDWPQHPAAAVHDRSGRGSQREKA